MAPATLPKLHLRSFSGNLTQWTSFWDAFQTAIHNNEQFTDIEKFNYLNSLLESSAREAISGFSLTAANYREAISLLKKRFGIKQHIVDKHLEVLFSIEPVVSANNVSGLRRLFDTVTSHIRSLESLNVQPVTYASTFCPKLLTKLPSELRLIVSRTLRDDEWSVASLLTAIEQEVTARERSGMNVANQPTQHRDVRPSIATAMALMSGNPSSSQPVCCYCSHPHKSIDCESVVQAGARKQILKKSGRCFICLKKGHLSRECRSTGRCRVCKGCHHSSICDHSMPRSADTQQSSSSRRVTSSRPSNASTQPSGVQRSLPPVQNSSTSAAALNPTAASFTSPPTSTSLYVGTNKAVLLQTALVEVYNPTNPSLTLKLRLILDRGSQRSYLTEQVKNTLGLQKIKRQHPSISTFGASRSDPRHCKVVRIGIVTKSGQGKVVELLVVPHICEPLTAQPVQLCSKTFPHLTPLTLADIYPADTPLDVDMLIGSDFYWQLTTGEIIRGQTGPVAVNTKLGWVLSGPVNSNVEDDSNATALTVHTLHIGNNNDEQLDKTLQAFWDLESLGIDSGNGTSHDRPTPKINLKDGRYEVSLPWREFHQPLPDNYTLSLRRLKGLLQRLRRDPKILQEYNEIIQDQLSKGIIELVEQRNSQTAKVHYLPHHAVIR